jgi:hypothetical protein
LKFIIDVFQDESDRRRVDRQAVVGTHPEHLDQVRGALMELGVWQPVRGAQPNKLS